jgi:hypothetical protein
MNIYYLCEVLDRYCGFRTRLAIMTKIDMKRYDGAVVQAETRAESWHEAKEILVYV